MSRIIKLLHDAQVLYGSDILPAAQPTNSVKALKQTQSNDPIPNQWLASFSLRLRKLHYSLSTSCPTTVTNYRLSSIFTARRNARIASAVLATAIPSVTCQYCVKMTASSMVQSALSDSKMCLVFQKPKNIPEGRPLPPEIVAQTDPPPPKSSEF